MEMKSLVPVLMVENVKQSVGFYESVLGFEAFVAVPNHEEPEFCIIRRNDISLMLQQRGSLAKEVPFFHAQPTGGTFTLYIKVDEIMPLYNDLKVKVTLVMDLTETFYNSTEFSIIDDSGYVLVFAEHKPAPTRPAATEASSE